MNKSITIMLFIIAVGLGAGGGYWYALKTEGTTTGETVKQAAKKPLFYRNPMNPQITSPVPAKDDMGMDYVPVYADQETEDAPAGTVKIDSVTVQDIGVRTAHAQRRTLSRTIESVGRVAHDEERLTRLHPKTEGWIEQLFVNKTGEPVQRDTILLNIYSPKLVTSQQEYLLAMNNLKSLEALQDSPFEGILKGARDLVRSSRERLVLLDVPEHQIRELEQTRQVKKSLHIHSPVKGIAMKINVREGQYVTPKTELFTLADLSRVWVYAEIYENELPWVQVGDEAQMRLAGVPGRVFRGQVTYVYPYAEAKTRTIKARLEFENEDLLLKPDMFANVTIHAKRSIDALAIPAPSVVRSGVREQVFVVRAPGKFEPREVKLGVSSGPWVQVLEGLEPGEEVVTSALFLIDSESKLREATAKMLEAGAGNGSESGGGPSGLKQSEQHSDHQEVPPND